MKKTYLFIYLFILLIPCTGQAQRRLSQRFHKHTLFVGASLQPTLKPTEFQDFDISDWQEFGLRSQNPSSAEGRVRVPLNNRINNGPTYGIALLYRYNVSRNFGITGAMPFTLSKNLVRFGLLPGLAYQFINKKGLFYTDDALRIGITPAAGIDIINIGFGKIKQIPAYTSPVIVKQGAFYDGYRLSVTAAALAYQAGLSLEYDASERITFLLQAGYGGSIFGKPDIQVSNGESSSSSTSGNSDNSDTINIKLTDASVVKTDLSGIQAAINPRIRSQGVYALAAIGFKFGKK